jgi:ribosomal-protein-alanine N-acetyltransferase
LEGLTLEPQTAAHASEMFAILSDPAIYEFEGQPPPSIEWLDGREQWLNWVIRRPDSRLAGYVQASIHRDGHSDIAYILSSDYWGKSYARRAVEAMISELADRYGVHTVRAVFKARNIRSRGLLERLSFQPATSSHLGKHGIEADELMMCRKTSCAKPAIDRDEAQSKSRNRK